MCAKKSDNSKQHVQRPGGYRHMRRARCGGEGAAAPSPRPSRRKLYGLSSHAACEVRGRGS